MFEHPVEPGSFVVKKKYNFHLYKNSKFLIPKLKMFSAEFLGFRSVTEDSISFFEKK